MCHVSDLLVNSDAVESSSSAGAESEVGSVFKSTKKDNKITFNRYEIK